jgi:drug/metabolite transporter (DMT)-like permease
VICAAAISNVLMFEVVKILGPARSTLFQFLVPVFAVTIAAVVLGEGIVAGQLIGGAVIVLGILVARRGRPVARPLPASLRAR